MIRPAVRLPRPRRASLRGPLDGYPIATLVVPAVIVIIAVAVAVAAFYTL